MATACSISTPHRSADVIAQTSFSRRAQWDHFQDFAVPMGVDNAALLRGEVYHWLEVKLTGLPQRQLIGAKFFAEDESGKLVGRRITSWTR